MDIELLISYFEKKAELASLMGLSEDATLGDLVDALKKICTHA